VFFQHHIEHVVAAKQDAADLIRLNELIGTDEDATEALLASSKVTAHLKDISDGHATAFREPRDEDRASAAEADEDEVYPTQDTLVLDKILADPRSGARPLGYR
jgi:hypothetical protein